MANDYWHFQLLDNNLLAWNISKFSDCQGGKSLNHLKKFNSVFLPLKPTKNYLNIILGITLKTQI